MPPPCAATDYCKKFIEDVNKIPDGWNYLFHKEKNLDDTKKLLIQFEKDLFKYFAYFSISRINVKTQVEIVEGNKEIDSKYAEINDLSILLNKRAEIVLNVLPKFINTANMYDVNSDIFELSTPRPTNLKENFTYIQNVGKLCSKLLHELRTSRTPIFIMPKEAFDLNERFKTRQFIIKFEKYKLLSEWLKEGRAYLYSVLDGKIENRWMTPSMPSIDSLLKFIEITIKKTIDKFKPDVEDYESIKLSYDNAIAEININSDILYDPEILDNIYSYENDTYTFYKSLPNIPYYIYIEGKDKELEVILDILKSKIVSLKEHNQRYRDTALRFLQEKSEDIIAIQNFIIKTRISFLMEASLVLMKSRLDLQLSHRISNYGFRENAVLKNKDYINQELKFVFGGAKKLAEEIPAINLLKPLRQYLAKYTLSSFIDYGLYDYFAVSISNREVLIDHLVSEYDKLYFMQLAKLLVEKDSDIKKAQEQLKSRYYSLSSRMERDTLLHYIISNEIYKKTNILIEDITNFLLKNNLRDFRKGGINRFDIYVKTISDIIEQAYSFTDDILRKTIIEEFPAKDEPCNPPIRTICGTVLYDKETCEMFDCCWNPAPGKPSCFYKDEEDVYGGGRRKNHKTSRKTHKNNKSPTFRKSRKNN